jgi:hypothetical protein
MACGYTYQGQLLRRALVVVEGGGTSNEAPAIPGGAEEQLAVGEQDQIPREPTVRAEEFQEQSTEQTVSELATERREVTSEAQPVSISDVFEEVEDSERMVEEKEPVRQEASEESSGTAGAVEEAAPRRGAKKKSPQDELPF